MTRVIIAFLVFVAMTVIASIRNRVLEGLWREVGKEEKVSDRSTAYSLGLAVAIFVTLFEILPKQAYTYPYLILLITLLIVAGIVLGVLAYTGIMILSYWGDKDGICSITRKHHAKYLIINIIEFELAFFLLIFYGGR